MQFAKLIKYASARRRLRFPVAFFLQTVYPSPAMHTPDLIAVAAVAQLAQWNFKFSSPCRIFQACFNVPYSIPVEISTLRICQYQICFLSGSSNIKLKARSMIMITIKSHTNDITVKFISFSGFADDLIGFAVKGPYCHINILIIVENIYLCRLRWFCAFARHPLCKVARPFACFPTGIVQSTVDHRLGGR